MDKDTITLGNITVTARHTPGHTPEHLSFLITDGAFSDQPGYMLSGDFIFAGDLGRPDLLDEAAGGVDTRFAGARDLFASLRDVFLKLPDHIQVYPGHGSGSACGKALGAVPSTTVATSATSPGGAATWPITTKRASSPSCSTDSPTPTPTSPE